MPERIVKSRQTDRIYKVKENFLILTPEDDKEIVALAKCSEEKWEIPFTFM